MPNQTLLTELLAVAGKDIGTVDVSNPVDVERYLSDLILAIGNLSEDAFNKLSPPARAWLNDVTRAYNMRGNLAEVAFAGSALQLSDLPTATAPKGKAAETPSSDAAKAETPSNAPPAKPKAKAQSKPKAETPRKAKTRTAYSKRNPWGHDTKSREVINAVIVSNGDAAKDMLALAKDKGVLANPALKQAINHSLQAFDCMREAKWLDLKNPAVKSFIQSIEAK